MQTQPNLASPFSPLGSAAHSEASDRVVSSSSDSTDWSASIVNPQERHALPDHLDITVHLAQLGVGPNPPQHCLVPRAHHREVFDRLDVLFAPASSSLERARAARFLERKSLITREQGARLIGSSRPGSVSVSSDRPLLASRGSLQALHVDLSPAPSRTQSPAPESLDNRAGDRSAMNLPFAPPPVRAGRQQSSQRQGVTETDRASSHGVEHPAGAGPRDGSLSWRYRLRRSIWMPQTVWAFGWGLATVGTMANFLVASIKGSRSLQNPNADSIDQAYIAGQMCAALLWPCVTGSIYIRNNREALEKKQAAAPVSVPDENV